MVVLAGRSMQNFTADEAQYEEAYDESGHGSPNPTSWWLIISKRAVNFAQNFPLFNFNHLSI